MTSLRQRVSTYFRQLSFIAEPHGSVDPRFASTLSPRNTPGDGCFMTKYLEGQMEDCTLKGSKTEIFHGKEPADLPDLPLRPYDIGPHTVVAACTGPDKGLTTVKRSRMHLSLGDDIDFIDTPTEDSSVTMTKPDRNANKEITNETKVRPRRLSKSGSQADESTTIHQMMTESRSSGKVNITVQRWTMMDNVKVESTPCPDSDKFNKNVGIRKKNVPSNEVTPGAIINCHTASSPDEYAGITNWQMENDNACGSPIADCFGLVVRGNSIALSLADGVNWGEGACLAARSAVQGSLDYLDKAVFGQVAGSMAKSTHEIFISLLRSFWSAHACILETGGSLTTLTVAVILPLAGSEYMGKSVVCSCNVGDSLGYVYSKEHGVREFTQGSHDVNIMRDMRDALGALGPVDGMKPELGNLTLSMTVVEANDIVFLTSDGISDNFDPVVGKLADASTDENNLQWTTPQRKCENRSTSGMSCSELKQSNGNFQLQKSEAQPIRPGRRLKEESSNTSNATSDPKYSRPSSRNRPKFLRSQTVIEPSRSRMSKRPTIKYSSNGLPLVSGPQRQVLTLLRIKDLLSYGINGTLQPHLSARRVCSLLIDFVRLITSAKRKMLEQRELFYKVATVVAPPDNCVLKKEIEMNRIQQRAARKRVVNSQTFSLLPGKLDHATVVAVRVPSVSESVARNDESNFVETNF